MLKTGYIKVMSSSPMNLPKTYALYIGNAYPHKNLEFLIRNWEGISVPLVIAGGRSIFYDRLEKLITSKKIIHLGYVDDLTELYKHAAVFVFPTLMEGFGLPPLEAMKHGVPVICSDIPVLHEVLGDAAIYFNPKDPNDLKKKLVYALANRKKLITAGKGQVKKYSWEKMAMETLEVYMSLRGA